MNIYIIIVQTSAGEEVHLLDLKQFYLNTLDIEDIFVSDCKVITE